MSIINKILSGICAGLMICIGCTVYVACYESNVVVGACAFAVALLTIYIKGYSLFTVKIGYIVEHHKKEDISNLLLGFLGNAIAVILFGIVIRFAIPNLEEVAEKMCYTKLSNQNALQTFARGIFCGVLMYVAVSIYKEAKTPLGIIYAIPVFILCGFEHSIADMGYFAISGIVSFDAFVFIWVVVLGNTVGGWLLPLLNKGNKKG